ncbi:hypothetical protein RF11_02192 [Thelohanellus kitauei]|uniref:Uncharacterized protein n=1 Tax=Thelohanellus kitauei TaxID=669202 RepID=A0A0C2MG88_THEKT|nr:hypothetical protein RF11_02192 [Thelohanellus kitauei]
MYFHNVLQANWASFNETTSYWTAISSSSLFCRLLTGLHLLRNFLRCERPASCEALVGFEKVRQLDLPRSHKSFPRQAELPRSQPAPHPSPQFISPFNEFGLFETVADRRLADLLPSTLCDV